MAAGCSYILGPCVDGTKAGKRCGEPATGDRCPRHQPATTRKAS